MIRALLAALCFYVSAGNAATIDPRNAKLDVCGKFEIFHINGVMTDRPKAEANLIRIREVYGNSYKEHILVYGLGFNQTRGFATDLYQSALQVISGYVGATWDKFMNAVTFGVYSIGMPEATAKAIAKVVTDKFAFTKPSPYQDQDLADIMNDFAQKSVFGSRLVIVPHSQGNLYANLVYDKLIATGMRPAKSIGVVGMAVPYSSVRSGNTYITSGNDFVIDSTRLPTLNNILGPNVWVPYQPSVDVLGHNLRDTYLANSTVRDMMNTRITSEFGGLRTVAPSPAWAPPSQNGGLVSYSWVRYNPPFNNGVSIVPENYWYYLPEPYGAYTGGWSGYIYGTKTAASAAAISVGKTCYNYHLAETKRQKALGNFNPWVMLYGGCWGNLGDPWAGTWWLYSGDGTPVFRSEFVTPYGGTAGPGSFIVSGGATCKR